MHPALRKGIILAIGTLVWIWGGMHYFDVQTPYGEWFNRQLPGDKVWIGVWIGMSVLMISDALYLIQHGFRQPWRR